MNWTQILSDAGIPEPPGRPEVLEQLAQRRVDRRVREEALALQKAEERRQKLAKSAGKRKS